MGVFEGLVLTLLTGCGIVLALLMVMANKALELLQYLVDWTAFRDREAGHPPLPQEFVGPSDMPLPKDLRDVLASQLGTGTFEGRQPWQPPVEKV